jgi:hypothetical protein
MSESLQRSLKSSLAFLVVGGLGFGVHEAASTTVRVGPCTLTDACQDNGCEFGYCLPEFGECELYYPPGGGADCFCNCHFQT